MEPSDGTREDAREVGRDPILPGISQLLSESSMLVSRSRIRVPDSGFKIQDSGFGFLGGGVEQKYGVEPGDDAGEDEREVGRDRLPELRHPAPARALIVI